MWAYSQAVDKQYHCIIGKKVKGQPIQEKHHVKEVTTLVESCCSASVNVSSASAVAIADLVQQGHLDLDYAVTSLINVAPLTSKPSGIVQALRILLQQQALGTEVASSSARVFKSPYGLRSVPHPFLSLLGNQPECWPYLLSESQVFLSHQDKWIRRSAIAALAPFLTYALLHPAAPSDIQPLTRELQLCLLQIHDDEAVTRDAVEFVLRLTPWLQTGSPATCWNVKYLLVDVGRLLTTLPRDVCSDFSSRLMLDMLSHALCMRAQGLQSSTLLLRAATLARTHVDEQAVDILLMLLALLLQSCTVTCLASLLDIGISLLGAAQARSRHVCAGLLAMPLQQVLMVTETSSLCHVRENHAAASKLMQLVENAIYTQATSTMKRQQSDSILYRRLPSSLHSLYLLVLRLQDSDYCATWLNSVVLCDCLAVEGLLLIASVLTTAQGDVLLMDIALQAAAELSRQHPQQAVGMFCLLLHILGRERDPHICHQILLTIPELAVHKTCVSPVLKTLRALTTKPGVNTTAIHLLTLLWMRQERTYPHLAKVLLDVQICADDPLFWAIMAAVRTICREKPYQRGTALVPLIYRVLTSCADKAVTLPSVLGLQSLAALCEAEVLDIRSTWLALEPIFTTEQRPSVVSGICQLLAIVPSLAVQSTEYEAFNEKVMNTLWQIVQGHKDTDTCRAALLALSGFNPANFCIRHLPAEIRPDLKDPEQGAYGAALETDDEIEESPIPGYCYIQMLKHVPCSPEYGAFLTAVCNREIESMPRHVYHVSAQRRPHQAQNRVIASVPEFLFNKYERCKIPSIQGNLALGVLRTFNPPLPVDKDGKIRRAHVLNKGRQFQHLLRGIVCDVPVQCGDWYCNLSLSMTWAGFMSSLLNAVTEGRKAELEIKQRKANGDADTVEESSGETAWLWARDQITDTLRTAARGTPQEQGNSVVALAALAAAVVRRAITVDRQTEAAATQFTSTNQWLQTMIDTVLRVLDDGSVPRGAIFNWLPHKGGTAGFLPRCSAAICLHLLLPAIIAVDADHVSTAIDCLLRLLPDGECATQPSAVTFHAGLGLGLFLASVYTERFLDLCSDQNLQAVLTARHRLEQCCVSGQAEMRGGCLAGQMALLCAMCSEGSTEAVEHVTKQHSALLCLLQDTNPMCSEFSVGCVCVAAVTACALRANVLQLACAISVLDLLTKLQAENPRDAALGQALGMMVHELLLPGRQPAIIRLKERLYGDWMKTLTDAGAPLLHRQTCLRGVLAIFGSEREITGMAEDVTETHVDSRLNDVLRLTMQILSGSTEVALQSCAAWMLGQVCAVISNSERATTTAPSDYSYLSDQYVLRPLISVIGEAGKLGPEVVRTDELELYVQALAATHARPLPPLNWASLLNPLLKLPFGALVQQMCLQIAINEGASSTSAAQFVSAWCIPPLYTSLQPHCKTLLCEKLPTLIRFLPPAKLRTLLERLIADAFSTDSEGVQLVSLLDGFSAALTVADPPQAVTPVLYMNVEHIYTLISAEENYDTLRSVYSLVEQLPENLVQRLVSFEHSDLRKPIFVCCHLVKSGKMPLQWLDKCIEGVLANMSLTINISWLLRLVGICLHRCSRAEHHGGEAASLQWMLNLLGKMREVMLARSEAAILRQKITALMQIFAACVVAFSTSRLHPLGTIAMQYDRQLHLLEGKNVSLGSELLSLLPVELPKLLQSKPWHQASSTVFSLLLLLQQQKNEFGVELSSIISDCFRELRHCSEFKGAAIWTQVVQLEV
ncbi:PREDICTED: focadhesin-like [Priapulus caudatus]|uniref:Focadhesin-like n=1 Tax=Priapulus caudatus TaxID=37621 RepID=A0ABM1DVJ5_PRICU|nr:PREDICTED: focadhesin-like [Priapulus caudatus]